MRTAIVVITLLAAATAAATPPAAADAPVRVAQNMTRAQIRSLPIEARPNRPIHFYGNAVRRRYHRGASPAAPPARPVR